MHLLDHHRLAPYTTLNLGGPARHFTEAPSVEMLREALQWARERGLPVWILGGGATSFFRTRDSPDWSSGSASAASRSIPRSPAATGSGQAWNGTASLSARLPMGRPASNVSPGSRARPGPRPSRTSAPTDRKCRRPSAKSIAWSGPPSSPGRSARRNAPSPTGRAGSSMRNGTATSCWGSPSNWCRVAIRPSGTPN